MRIKVTFDIDTETRRRIAKTWGLDPKKPAPRYVVETFIVGSVLGEMETLDHLDDD
jgi:hypothetical protein